MPHTEQDSPLASTSGDHAQETRKSSAISHNGRLVLTGSPLQGQAMEAATGAAAGGGVVTPAGAVGLVQTCPVGGGFVGCLRKMGEPPPPPQMQSQGDDQEVPSAHTSTHVELQLPGSHEVIASAQPP